MNPKTKHMPAEFDEYAASDYGKLLRDPLRDNFAGSRFFFERKLTLLRELYEQYAKSTQSAIWLDVGCGEGTLLEIGKKYFKEVAGCDVSAAMLQRCEHVSTRLQLSPRQIPFPDGSFDLVTAACVYHHVDTADRFALTAEISRVLKPKGMLCVFEHNPLNPLTRLIVHRSPIDRHAHLLTAGKFKRLARAGQMKVLATRYFLYFPERFYSTMAATEAKLFAVPLGGQYAVLCQKT